jgi:N-acetyl-alpha-D-glucosaminyl L-malate synthase BshA
VTTLHGTDITLVGNDPSYAPLTQFVIYASDAATAVSDWLAEQTRERFCPDMKCPRPIEVIPNFIDVERFRPGLASHSADAPPMVVQVSNFRAVKRVPWLVRAFAEATAGTKAQLVLVGDGPDQAECRRLVQELDIAARVVFLGERDAIPELMAPADVFALASREESFGLSALEAMACGTPVVSTDAGGVREVVEHGVSGLLSPVEDMRLFSAHLKHLLEDRATALAMGSAARAQAVERFRREKVVVLYEDLYRRVLAARR